MDKLIKKIIIKGKLECISGLHIGGDQEGVEIGGLDNPVIRRTVDRQPYIPGSSLKGKMRCLLQQSLGVADEKYKPGCPVSALFGGMSTSDSKERAQSRVIVRDAYLTEEWEERLRESEHTDMPYTEIKWENKINRITGTAEHPRQQERIPAGAEFKVEFVLNIFEQENEKQLLTTLKKCVDFLNDDYLGGSGTRGYGQVKLEMDWECAETHSFANIEAELKQD